MKVSVPSPESQWWKKTDSLESKPSRWMFPKIVGFPPKSSIKKWVFHEKNHPFWGVSLFLETSRWVQMVLDLSAFLRIIAISFWEPSESAPLVDVFFRRSLWGAGNFKSIFQVEKMPGLQRKRKFCTDEMLGTWRSSLKFPFKSCKKSIVITFCMQFFGSYIFLLFFKLSEKLFF